MAVSGFPAAGKTTLGGLTAQRLEGGTVVHVGELLAAEPTATASGTGTGTGMAPDLPAGLAAAHRSVLEDVRAERTGWLILEGTHLLHPDLRDPPTCASGSTST